MEPILLKVGEVADFLASASDRDSDAHRRQIHHWAQHHVFQDLETVGTGRTAARRFRLYHVFQAHILTPFYALGFNVSQLWHVSTQMNYLDLKNKELQIAKQQMLDLPFVPAIHLVFADLLYCTAHELDQTDQAKMHHWAYRFDLGKNFAMDKGYFYIPFEQPISDNALPSATRIVLNVKQMTRSLIYNIEQYYSRRGVNYVWKR